MGTEFREFLKIKRRLVRRVERARSDRKPSRIDRTYAQYRECMAVATDDSSCYPAGELTAQKAMAFSPSVETKKVRDGCSSRDFDRTQ